MTAYEPGGPLPLSVPSEVATVREPRRPSAPPAKAEAMSLRDRVAEQLLRCVLADFGPDDVPSDIDRAEARQVADSLMPLFAAEVRSLADVWELRHGCLRDFGTFPAKFLRQAATEFEDGAW